VIQRLVFTSYFVLKSVLPTIASSSLHLTPNQ
jgi:hypothetical protein